MQTNHREFDNVGSAALDGHIDRFTLRRVARLLMHPRSGLQFRKIAATSQERLHVAALVREVMENAYPLEARLKADVSVGPNLDEMQAIK